MNNIVAFNQDALAAMDAFASETTTGSASVTFLKFAKGEWIAGTEGVIIDDQEDLAVNMATLSHGFICWKDKQVAGEEMALVTSGMVPRIGELNDIPGSKGWTAQSSVELQHIDTGETYLFKTSSKGGVSALGTLAKDFMEQMRSGAAEQVPVVSLQSTSYKHSDYGKIHTPVLEVVEWLAPGEVDAPVEKVAEAELVEEDPAPKPTPRARKTRRKVSA